MPNTLDNVAPSPGKQVDLAGQLVLQPRADRDTATAVRHPRAQLDQRLVANHNLIAAAGQQQISDRDQIDRVGLGPPRTVDPPLPDTHAGFSSTNCQPPGNTPEATSGR